MITGLLGWLVYAAVEMPTPFLVLVLIGLFFLSFAVIGVVAPHVLSHVPPPARKQRDANGSTPLQKVRLIRNEIAEGVDIVTRAVGVSQVYELVVDHNWIGHRNELAAIPEAGDAYRLAGRAWAGFRRYNEAVKGRSPISNEELTEIAADGRRAVDALGVAADALR